jgi:hypothetical protein
VIKRLFESVEEHLRTMSPRSIADLVALCTHWDKDERYMALNDLYVQLVRDDVKINLQEEAR